MVKIPLSEYPRPQLVRDSYLCLNGQWDYAIYNKDQEFSGYTGKINVPYSPEAPLSGVGKVVMPTDILYYRTQFTLDTDFLNDRVILHFGAVDYDCKVYLNDVLVKQNRGGYLPFSVDITHALSKDINTLRLEVVDPTDASFQSRGKQKLKRGGIFYTPQSGIWQTVWLESVPNEYIESIIVTPDIDKSTISVHVKSNSKKDADIFVIDNGKTVASAKTSNGNVVIDIKDMTLWSPQTPHLYDLQINLGLDTVKSYFGMRKFGFCQIDGKKYLALNNQPYFFNGLLDQGYFMDGLYTPSDYNDMVEDIMLAKNAGFNMLRKHIKIEPLRWYYLCDKLGMLVIQDMVNGGRGANSIINGIKGFLSLKVDDGKYQRTGRQDKEGRDEFNKELLATVETLYNVVSIAMWVPFNESWGQFDARLAYDKIKAADKTRLIDHASGWHDQGAGDFKSIHVYFKKIKVPKRQKRAVFLSEFGGYSMAVEGHVYNPLKTFGYKKFETRLQLANAYQDLFDTQIIPQISKGLAATVYTQLSDVEDETNGIITYDRKVVKFDMNQLRSINESIYKAFEHVCKNLIN